MIPMNPMIEQSPDGRAMIRVQDGSLIPLLDVSVRTQVEMDTVMVPANGAPVVVPVVQALAMERTLAAHWLQRFTAGQEEIANLRAKLHEAQGEGRVYELDADIRVTPEEFAEMKDTLRALDEYFDIDDAQGVEDLRVRLTTGDEKFPIVAIPDDLRVACAQLGFTTVGGLRQFCEHYKIPVPEVARG